MKISKLRYLFAVAFFGISGFYASNLISDESNKIDVHASWSYITDTAEGLIEESQLVAVASVDKIEKKSYFPYPDEPTIVFTDATLNINEILYSDENLKVGDKITLSQYGGELTSGELLTYDDVPLLEKKEQVLVFLEKVEDDTVRSGKYQYVGGNIGLYLLGDVINSASTNQKVNIQSVNSSKVAEEVKKIGFENIKEKAKGKQKNKSKE